MDLFADSQQKNLDRVAPLAARPRSLAEFTGQQHSLGLGKLLRRMLEADGVPARFSWNTNLGGWTPDPDPRPVTDPVGLALARPCEQTRRVRRLVIGAA